jgi:hypothetical protein
VLDEVIADRVTGRPSRRILELGARCLGWLGHHRPTFYYLCGSQFLVDGRTLLTRTPEFYLDLEVKVKADVNGPWLIERMWPEVWR